MGSGTWATWVVFGLIALGIFAAVRAAGKGAGNHLHCMTCGTDGSPKKRTRGSIWIEIVLWLCFLVPGLIYSIWRLTTRREVCASCGSEALVPINAPAAISHRKTLAA